MPRTSRQLRQFAPDASGDTALTLAELMNMTAEGKTGLKRKLLAGQFRGAYRTSGGTGEWRIPLRALRAYQKARSVTAP